MNTNIKEKLVQITLLLSLSAGLVTIQGCAPVIVAGTVAGAGATLVSDRRSTTALIEDQAIEIKATDAIYRDRELGKKVRIAVTSFNGLVLLSGEAPSQDYRLKAADIIRNLASVREVYNEIQVSQPISLNDRTHDAWITSKVKARLVQERGLFTRTKVVTSGGVVYLMGIATESEANQATSLIHQLDGIQRVIALFEPTSPDALGNQNVAGDNLSPGLRPTQDLAPDEAEALAEEEKDLKIVIPPQEPLQLMSSGQ
ncbi:MAG: BON domain-containing protein [Gammaproteobacteria bacterium]|nr:BON domain-containing protein [Gammaproteobacteria bacterium]MDH5691540.1 BON domain-containing protein [Gammaproteobacteria bacterium]